jgi:tRNA(Arg) A34 adenosine deaminase TadA
MELQTEHTYISKAIELAIQNIDNEGGPFGALIVFNGEIIATGSNTVTSSNDPTAHAEINAIRLACQTLKTFDLSGCILYSSCEPCPMCLSAIYWSHIDKVFFSLTSQDAHNAGFDDAFLYSELTLPLSQRKIPFAKIDNCKSFQIFDKWIGKKDKILY